MSYTATRPPDRICDVVILGSGLAGLTAAIYTARANIHPLVLSGLEPGGQLLVTAADLEDFPGFAEPVSGPDLISAAENQARRFGAELSSDVALSVDLSRRPFAIQAAELGLIHAKTLIIATGSRPKSLGFPSERALWGKGVSTCATDDGFFFRDKDVVVIGGGDAAINQAIFLKRYARSVTVIHRRYRLRASKILQDRAFHNGKIAFVLDSVVTEILDPARGKVTGVRLVNVKTGEESVLPTDGVFVAIGRKRNSELFRGQLDLDDEGYIRLTRGMQTSIPGVFAAGAIHDAVYHQAITAAGDGCRAALDALRFLEAEEAAGRF